MRDWKIYLKPEASKKIDELGYEVAELFRTLDQKGNYAKYNAKWFELYQISLKSFCRNVRLEEPKKSSTPNDIVVINTDKVPDEVQDAFQQVMEECVHLYDPDQGRMSVFMTTRFKQRLIDENNKAIIDITTDDGKNWRDPKDNNKYEATNYNEAHKATSESNLSADNKKKKAPVSLESVYAKNADGSNEGRGNKCLTDGGMEELMAEASVDHVFLSLASEIIELSQRLQMRSRVSYYKLFYTSDMISFLKIRKSRPFFLHEDKVYKSLKPQFVDYCLINTCESLAQIQDTPLKFLRQIFSNLPENDKRLIPVPIEEDIELAYMNDSPQESTITTHTLRAQKSNYNALYKKIRSRG